ncbi:antibiotic biosynthesis monooxygenase [Streptomyces sp. CAU 1734]|uniref:antibiotic biosynthesis monooxygenase n=1 Tax=Streptomyces sp. CAU 1734 TaxID=3140360 RepID=UPI00326114CC
MSVSTTVPVPAAVAPHARPDIGRPGVGVVKVSTWDVGTPERQRAALAAIARAWRSREWPDAGLLSYTIHAGEDGRTLLHYSQWTGEEAYRDFVRTHRDERNAEIDAAVPGVARLDLHSYELYPDGVRGAGDPRIPGAVVVVEAELDGSGGERRRAGVDGVLAAPAGDAPDEAGAGAGKISGWLHLGTDGTRILHYAEWETADAHRAARDDPGEGAGGAWQRLRSLPGVRVRRVHRCVPGLSLRPGV